MRSCCRCGLPRAALSTSESNDAEDQTRTLRGSCLGSLSSRCLWACIQSSWLGYCAGCIASASDNGFSNSIPVTPCVYTSHGPACLDISTESMLRVWRMGATAAAAVSRLSPHTFFNHNCWSCAPRARGISAAPSVQTLDQLPRSFCVAVAVFNCCHLPIGASLPHTVKCQSYHHTTPATKYVSVPPRVWTCTASSTEFANSNTSWPSACGWEQDPA